MKLKGQFIKSGEEAYALDAFTSEKLKAMNMHEVRNRDPDSTDRIYKAPGDDRYRLVRKAGYARNSLVSFGSISREFRDGACWKEDATVSLEDFVNEDKPFDRPAHILTLGPKL